MMKARSGTTTPPVPEEGAPDSRAGTVGRMTVLRWTAVVALTALSAWTAVAYIEDAPQRGACVIAAACLALWLSEAVPSFVPTLVLWAGVPLALGGYGEEYRSASVLGWAADPVLALFLGGFALSVAASRYGLDERLARFAFRRAGASPVRLILLVALVTAALSMWMSNIAAAALMLAAVRPLLADAERDAALRRALLLSIAFGADFGGIATPVGTGPNGIAIAAVAHRHAITFLDWMIFALPLTVGLIAASVLLIATRSGVTATRRAAAPREEETVAGRSRGRGAKLVLLVFLLTVAAWLSEPLHGAPAGVVALMATAALFGAGLLDREDFRRIDWATLVLIAGGITLGRLLETSGLVRTLSAGVAWSETDEFARTFLLCLASALLSALMSNTATATMLIPLALSLDPAPSTAVLVAVASSLGVPFVVSTPPNAIVFGEGGLKTSDLLVPGLLLMLGGCLLIALTGRYVLNLVGVP